MGVPYAARTKGEKNGAICWALDRWMGGLSAWEGRLRLALENMRMNLKKSLKMNLKSWRRTYEEMW